jgi:outer membrane protein, heavy metal efflux system
MWFIRVRFGCLCLLIVVCFTQARAQSSSSPVTINQAVQEALERNLGLLADRYNLSIADARIITARLRPNPVLSIRGHHLDLLGTGFSEINGASPAEYSIRTDFIFERGNKRRRRIEVAEQAK